MFQFCSIPFHPHLRHKIPTYWATGASADHSLYAPHCLLSPVLTVNPPPFVPVRARTKSPRSGGPVRTEPLDDESERTPRQRLINRDSYHKRGVLPDCITATRGESWSRELRKPQSESVKKKLVIESSESIVESFCPVAATLLRGRPPVCIRPVEISRQESCTALRCPIYDRIRPRQPSYRPSAAPCRTAASLSRLDPYIGAAGTYGESCRPPE